MEVTRVLRRRHRRRRHDVVMVRGELDVATAPELARLLADPAIVVVDLSCVTFLDAAGVRVLVACVADAARAGRPMQLRAPSVAVRRVLELTELSALMTPHAA